MVNIQKFHSADLNSLVDRINKYSIGMDDIFDRLSHVHETQGNYPPYNLVQISNTESRLELALAGFTKDDIEVEVADGILTVRSVKESEDVTDEWTLHRGISYRKFNRKFTLSDDVVVNDAKLENGLLTVELEQIVPEEKKPRLITIK